ncbi:MAG: SEC-C metal-binding domain-containing protein, partial [Hellea sp.]|nr:SEC-C metal-binding domain-containing protein [Hellea sp.]
LTEKTKENLAMDIPFSEWAKEEGIADEEMLTRLKKSTDEAFEQLTGGIESKEMQRIEKQLLLQVIDQNWREHLQQLDNLKSVIGMRAYGQRDPLNEYKSEAFTLFDRLLTDLREGVTKAVTRLLINVQMQRQQERIEKVQKIKDSARSPMDMISITKDNSPQLSEKDFEGISRNSLCPCGSGKKFKKCCGKTN